MCGVILSPFKKIQESCEVNTLTLITTTKRYFRKLSFSNKKNRFVSFKAAKSCIYRLKQAYIIWMSKKSAKIDKFFSVFWPNTDLVSQEWAFMKDNFIRNKVAK